GDPLVQAEGRHRTGVGVPVVAQRFTAQRGDDVVGHRAGLPYGVLRAGTAVLAGTGEVGYGGAVAGAEHLAHALDVEARGDLDPVLLIPGQVAGAHQRVGAHPGGPHERSGLELVAVVEHDVLVLSGDETGF